ncbi:prolyl oligopeptidase family serine peptidase [Aquimarina sp. 2201CG1-2-11]|uniref:prolyl oligopeptidase family serine peptidase n=1 Tax=Aquimarina discodermiae TaxID=3231043 RepID=UPI0034638403
MHSINSFFKSIIIKLSLLLTIMINYNCQPQNKLASVDLYHGIQINDEYRHLENLNDSTVIHWFKKQGQLTQKKLHQIPKRADLIQTQKELGATDKGQIKNIQVTAHDQHFYLKKTPHSKQYSLYFRESLRTQEELLYDPKDFLPELGKQYYINYYKPSWDGTKVLISLTKDGEEFAQILIFDMINRKMLPIEMKNCLPTYGGAYWLPDNSGIMYLQVPIAKNIKEAYLNTEFVLQKLEEKEPKVLLSRVHDPELEMKPEDIPNIYIKSDKSKYIIGAVTGATPYQDYYYSPYKQIDDLKFSWKPLFKKEDKVSQYYQEGDSIIYRASGNGFSNFRICKTSFINPNIKNPVVLVAEKKDEVITNFTLVKGGIFYTTTKNGVEAKLYFRKKTGKTEQIPLPFAVGKIYLSSKGKEHKYLAIEALGWLNKKQRYIYNFTTNEFESANLIKVENNGLTKDIIVEEIEIPSHDGIMVPLSLIYDKKLIKNGNNPVFMIGYGAYGISIPPSFTTKIMTWALKGGIFAVAHVRGGGEKGDSWYKGGFKQTKPNSWKDLIACTEYLIDQKYTSPKKMALHGGSAGCITVGRAMTERPDLFAGVILSVGFLNTVRIEQGFNGENNAKEFGSVEDPEEFKGLLEMDSYHHIKKGVAYPATLITTGMNDSRVAPWHSAKFTSKLQESNASDNPVLLRVKFKSGHSSNSTQERLENVADVLSFAFWQTGHPDYQPKK